DVRSVGACAKPHCPNEIVLAPRAQRGRGEVGGPWWWPAAPPPDPVRDSRGNTRFGPDTFHIRQSRHVLAEAPGASSGRSTRLRSTGPCALQDAGWQQRAPEQAELRGRQFTVHRRYGFEKNDQRCKIRIGHVAEAPGRHPQQAAAARPYSVRNRPHPIGVRVRGDDPTAARRDVVGDKPSEQRGVTQDGSAEVVSVTIDAASDRDGKVTASPD